MARKASSRRRHAACRLARRGGRFCHDRQRHRRRASGAGVRRSRLSSAASTSKPDFVDGAGPQLICAVGPDGKFTAEAPDYQGRWVKDADKDIARELRHRGLLYHQEQYLHEYPFCWRAEEDPLIQYPRESWFIRTTAIQRRDADQQSARSTGCRSTSATAGSAIFWNRTSIGPSRASAIGARRCRSGFAKQTGLCEAVGSYDELLPSRACRGPKSGTAAKQKNPELVRPSESPQAVYRRGHLRLRRSRACRRERGCGACPT